MISAHITHLLNAALHKTNFNVSVYIIRCVSACVCVQSALAVKNRTKFYKNTI